MRRIAILCTLLLTACTSATTDEVTLLDGTPSTIEELRMGRPAIINFWASWSRFSAEELVKLQNIHEQFSGISVIGVNVQESQPVARTYWDDNEFTFPSFLDPGKELKAEFDVFTEPTTIVLDAEGNVLFRKDGPITEPELEQNIDLLLLETATGQ